MDEQHLHHILPTAFTFLQGAQPIAQPLTCITFHSSISFCLCLSVRDANPQQTFVSRLHSCDTISCHLALLPHFPPLFSFCSIRMLLSLIIPSLEGAVFGVCGGAAVLCH